MSRNILKTVMKFGRTFGKHTVLQFSHLGARGKLCNMKEVHAHRRISENNVSIASKCIDIRRIIETAIDHQPVSRNPTVYTRI